MRLLASALPFALTASALAQWTGGIGWGDMQATYTRTSEFAGTFTASGMATLDAWPFGSAPMWVELNLPIELRPGQIGFGHTNGGLLTATDTDGDSLVMPVAGIWESETYGVLRFDAWTSAGTMVASSNSDFAFGPPGSSQVPFSFLAYSFQARIDMFVTTQPPVLDLNSSFVHPTSAYVYLVPTPASIGLVLIGSPWVTRRRR